MARFQNDLLRRSFRIGVGTRCYRPVADAGRSTIWVIGWSELTHADGCAITHRAAGLATVVWRDVA